MRKNIKHLTFIVFTVSSTLLLTNCSNTQNPNESDQKKLATEHETSNQGELNSLENPDKAKGYLASILSNYFLINESLVKDDGTTAAENSKKLIASLEEFKDDGGSDKNKSEVNQLLLDAIKNAHQISTNASEIKLQREYLIPLSLNIKKLVEIIGVNQVLYEAYCPMANNNNGAIWISNQEEISNPYMGTMMPKCGKVNQVLD